MPSESSKLAQYALDWLALLVAAMFTAFGPFVSVYLVGQGWDQGHLGVTLSVGTAAAVIFQLPTGALVDALPTKRAVAALGILGAGASALLLAGWPAHWPVMISQVLFAVSAGVLGPVIAAISLTLVGPRQIGYRFGRNARFAAIGSAFAAVALGLLGSVVSVRAIFVAAAVLAVPALATLWRISTPERPMRELGAEPIAERPKLPLRQVLRDRRLVSLAVVIFLFHLANAAMLPVAAAEAALTAGIDASSLIAVSILVSQFVPILFSPRIGIEAERIGRRPLLLIGFCCLPARGFLHAVVHSPFLLPAIQVLDGVSAALIGVILPLLVSDLTRNTGRFNLCLALVGLAAALGATLSTTLAGTLADAWGHEAAFWFLGGIGLAGSGLVWRLMPETRPLPEAQDRPRT